MLGDYTALRRVGVRSRAGASIMKLDLSEIAAHLGKRIKYKIDEKPIEDVASGLKCVEPIVGEATFSNTGRAIIVHGHFRTRVELECGRCLQPYQLDVESPIDEVLQISGLPPGVEEEDEEELPEEEKEPLFVDYIFDLEELLRQSILIAVPIKPLCSEACKGLCSRCGANLNEGECGCPSGEEVTPFSALASLLEKDDEESES